MTASIQTLPYDEVDVALLTGLRRYEEAICPGGCGQPIAEAWHGEMSGFYEVDEFVCHACTARRRAGTPEGKEKPPPVVFTAARNAWPAARGPLPTFVFGVSTGGP